MALSNYAQLQEKVSGISNLPTLPQIASRLVTTINDPTTSANDVAFLVSQDMSLSAKVLRLANSAFYGIPRSITSIQQAVVILGMKVINTMVLSLTVFDMFPQDKGSRLFNREAFWRHCLGCALISRILADTMKSFVIFDSEEAFGAGLLHDIGKVVMEQYFHEDFHKALTLAQEKNISFFDAEKEALGFTHVDIAGWLTEDWNLPQELLLPLIHHHAPAESQEYSDIVALCHYADWLCYQTGIVIDSSYAAPKLDEQSVAKLNIDQKVIEKIKGSIDQELKKMTVFFDLVSGK
ncbi:MAG: HDOD domain-containing protein [Chitinivibrionales bacterium]|nr:HDOD domain-containing protein [Chitinivibrionales bacterium]